MYTVKDAILKRRSVRTFSGLPLSEEDAQRLTELLGRLDNPFGVPVQFRMLDAKAHGLSSAVIVGTDRYVAAKVRRAPQFELALGYSFEKFCLDAAALGIGTVMLAATFSRAAAEKAIELESGEVMPLVSPVGYPADKMSVREKLMRKGTKADDRLPFETLFFDGSFARSLTPEAAGRFRDALEMVRLAPSAANKQPWRCVVCGDVAHFYKKSAKALVSDATGDIQKVDIGIALAHFDLTLREAGISGRFFAEDPGLVSDDTPEYIISCEINRG